MSFIEREQFEPSLIGIFINPFYIARRGLFRNIRLFGGAVTGKTLDVGCGTKPYEHLFNSTEYIGMEIETTTNRKGKKADVYYGGGGFPFNDGEFDSLVTNQVFEHVFNPYDFLKEINRVMKQNGTLLLTVPFVWDEHEKPYDYARYSSYGIQRILEQHGFGIITLVKSVNDVSLIAQLINGYLYKKTMHNVLLRRITTATVMATITILGIVLGRLLPKNDDFYLDNVILAKKVSSV